MIFRVSVRSAMWTSDAKALENIAFPEKTVFRQEMTADHRFSGQESATLLSHSDFGW
jgi:hypothetical protein